MTCYARGVFLRLLPKPPAAQCCSSGAITLLAGHGVWPLAKPVPMKRASRSLTLSRAKADIARQTSAARSYGLGWHPL